MAGGHVPNFAKRTEVSYPMAGLDLAPTRSGGKVDGIDTARMSIALGGDTKKRGSTRATPYQLPWDTSQYRADATGISDALLNNKGIRDIGNEMQMKIKAHKMKIEALGMKTKALEMETKELKMKVKALEMKAKALEMKVEALKMKTKALKLK